MAEKIITRDWTRQEQQIFAAKISIWAAVVSFLASAAVGIAVDSIALILDASTSLVILFVAFLMHVSIKKVHRPPDDLYNFGYGKYEPFTVAVQGGLIIATCVISIKFAIQDIVNAEDIKNYGLAVIVTFLSGILGIFIARYLKKTAMRTASPMLKTAGFHWAADTALSFGMCAGFLSGLILRNLGFTRITPYVDPVMAIILALFFIKTPLKAITRNVLELLDAVPDEDIYSKVKRVVEQYKPKSFGVYRLRTRKAGQKIFVDICFIVRGILTVTEVEELADSFERDLKVNLPDTDVVVYFKPFKAKSA